MVSAAHFSFMGTCRNTTFKVLYYNLFSGISRWYHYHKSEVNSMKAEKKEINIQIGKGCKPPEKTVDIRRKFLQRRWM